MRNPVLKQLDELNGKTPEQIDQFVFAEGLDKQESLRRLALKIRSEQADPATNAKRYWSRSLQAKVMIQPVAITSIDCVLGYQLTAEGQIELVYGLVLPSGAEALKRLDLGSYLKREEYPFDTPDFDDQSRHLVAYSGSQLQGSLTFIIGVPAQNTDYVARRVSQALRLGSTGIDLKFVLEGPTPAYRDASRALVPSGDYFLDEAQQVAYANALYVISERAPQDLRDLNVKEEVDCGAALLIKAQKDFTEFCATKANKKREQRTLAREFNEDVYKNLVTVDVVANGSKWDLTPHYAMTDEQAKSFGLTAEWQAVKISRANAAAVDLIANIDLMRKQIKDALEQVKTTVKNILDNTSFPRFLRVRLDGNKDLEFTTEATLLGGRIAFTHFSISDNFIEGHAPALQKLELNQKNRSQVYAAFKAELKNRVSDYLTAKHHEAEEKKRIAALPKKVKASDLLETAQEAYFSKHEKRKDKSSDLDSYHSFFMKRLVNKLKENPDKQFTLKDLASEIAPAARQNRYCLFGDRGRTVGREKALQDAAENKEVGLNEKYGTDAALKAVIAKFKAS